MTALRSTKIMETYFAATEKLKKGVLGARHMTKKNSARRMALKSHAKSLTKEVSEER